MLLNVFLVQFFFHVPFCGTNGGQLLFPVSGLFSSGLLALLPGELLLFLDTLLSRPNALL
jgi:hypothetical protein